MPRYQDPETGKFISEDEAKRRGINPLGGAQFSFNESAQAYFEDRMKESGLTQSEVFDELFGKEFMLVEFDEVTGKATLQIFAGEDIASVRDMKSSELRKIYKDLRENFPPVSAGIEYHKTFMVGSGFDIIVDNPEDKHELEMRDACEEMSSSVYMDYYRKGLDKILNIMVDDVLTFGACGAEVVYGREVEFEEFADFTEETIEVNGKRYKKKIWEPIDPNELSNRDWKSLKEITRLKIIDNAMDRLTAKVDTVSNEILYWVLDEAQSTPQSEIQQRVSGDMGPQPTYQDSGIKFHPFEIFWLSWNTRGTSLFGESIIRPVVEIAMLLRKIQKDIGVGFDRWAEKKYFFICGTEKRPWSKNAQRKFLKYLELMVKNHWTGIPVPAGFDVKDIGGQIFEGTDIQKHLTNMICAGMNYPVSFLEQGRTGPADQAWLAWQVKYGANQRQCRRDVEHQLFEKHLWCKFGKTYKVPKQGVEARKRETKATYVPKMMWNAEGRFQKAEELKTLQGWLNVANPVGPEFKLAIEKRGAELLGFGDIPFPTYKELRKQILEEEEMAREMQMAQMKLKEQTNEAKLKEQAAERQAGGVSRTTSETGDKPKEPPKVGGTRIPKVKKKGMPNKST